MTKEQREEIGILACKYSEKFAGHWSQESGLEHAFEQGFTAGVESEKKRTQVLVEALNGYAKGRPVSNLFSSKAAIKALAQYQKGDK